MRFITIIAFLLLPLSQSSGQVNPGAINAALAYSGLAADSTSFSLFNNPAGLSLSNDFSLSLFLSPSPYGLKELCTKSAALKIHSAIGNFGFGYLLYGYELFKEQKLILGYSHSILDNVHVGISTIYQNVSIKNYGSKNTIIFLTGAIYQITEEIGVGFTIYNPFNSSYTKEKDEIPSYFETGASFYLSPSSSINIAFKKEMAVPVSLRAGLNYCIANWLTFLAGYKTEPETFSGGVSIQTELFGISYSLFSHDDLGFTHQFGINIF